jgi:hypothetical protein
VSHFSSATRRTFQPPFTWLGDTEATTQKHYAHLIKSDVDIELLNGKQRKKRKDH